MRWDLILIVAALGPLLGLLTIFGVVDVNQWVASAFYWIVSAVILGGFIAKKHFVQGFLAGAIGAILSSLVSYFLFDTYAANNAEMAERMKQMPEGFDLRTMILIGAPVGAALGGVVLGLLTLLCGKLFGPKETPKPALAKEPEPPAE